MSELFDGIDDGLKRLGIVHGEVGENLTVETDILLGEFAHELGIGDPVLARGGVDPLNPKGAEVALLGLAVAIGVSQTFPHKCSSLRSRRSFWRGNFRGFS